MKNLKTAYRIIRHWSFDWACYQVIVHSWPLPGSGEIGRLRMWILKRGARHALRWQPTGTSPAEKAHKGWRKIRTIAWWMYGSPSCDVRLRRLILSVDMD